MKVSYENYINLSGVTREEAEALLKLLPRTKLFKDLVSELKDGLAPRYEYKVPCSECRNHYILVFREKLTPARLKEESGGVCASCSDDFK